MEPNDSNLKSDINRLVWIIIFTTGAATLGVMEWLEPQPDHRLPLMGWFLAAGIWSAVCGIGYSVCDWFLTDRSATISPVTRVPGKDVTADDGRGESKAHKQDHSETVTQPETNDQPETPKTINQPKQPYRPEIDQLH